jgi:hypothetical protein
VKRRGALIAIGGALAILGCAWTINSGTYRFRMTVEANTPQGPRSASAVYEVYANKNILHILPEEAAGGLTTRGQAVVLDLPSGPVFVLMKVPSDTDGLGSTVTKTFRPDAFGGAEHVVPAVRAIGYHFWGTLKAELSASVINPYGVRIPNWPMMVRFRDINDPKSIEQVDPTTIGVKRIWVETTRDPITTGIEKRLGWFNSFKDHFFDGSPTSFEDLRTKQLSAHLSSHSFTSEVRQ